MVPDIWSVTDRIFCHYGPFLPFYPPIGPENQNFEKIKKKNTWRYYDFTNVYHRWKAYDIWFFRRGVQQTKLFVIMVRFLLFCSPPPAPNNPKNQNFEKLKKTLGDIMILHKCTKNYDQMMYGSWDMVRDRCNCYFSFWVIFCPFTPLTAQKIKLLKKWKKMLEISSFYICIPKIMIRWCMVPEICCATDGWTDGQKKWHIEVGAPLNNKIKLIC